VLRFNGKSRRRPKTIFQSFDPFRVSDARLAMIVGAPNKMPKAAKLVIGIVCDLCGDTYAKVVRDWRTVDPPKPLGIVRL